MKESRGCDLPFAFAAVLKGGNTDSFNEASEPERGTNVSFRGRKRKVAKK